MGDNSNKSDQKKSGLEGNARRAFSARKKALSDRGLQDFEEAWDSTRRQLDVLRKRASEFIEQQPGEASIGRARAPTRVIDSAREFEEHPEAQDTRLDDFEGALRSAAMRRVDDDVAAASGLEPISLDTNLSEWGAGALLAPHQVYRRVLSWAIRNLPRYTLEALERGMNRVWQWISPEARDRAKREGRFTRMVRLQRFHRQFGIEDPSGPVSTS